MAALATDVTPPAAEDWPDRLSAPAPERERAIAELHALLVRAARHELRRRDLAAAELDDLAVQAADDALVAVLAKLHTFRGASRFTTWAYKFALLEAGVKARRRAWHGREIPLADDAWPAFADPGPGAHESAETAELLRAIRDAVHRELTDHQREVFVALALHEVPIDVLAERRGTTRGEVRHEGSAARAPARACGARGELRGVLRPPRRVRRRRAGRSRPRGVRAGHGRSSGRLPGLPRGPRGAARARQRRAVVISAR
jgi:RNA polymerase sigma-70 factor (ECF subfamily)